MRSFDSILIFFLLASLPLAGALEPQPAADGWLTNSPPLPERFRGSKVGTNHFYGLQAEVIGGQFRVRCTATNVSDMHLVASIEAPGHWPARDWQSHRMLSNAASWFVELPIERMGVPVIYFAMAKNGQGMIASPLRMALPGALGLEEPTHFFWPYVEGFEQELGSWRVHDPGGTQTDALARNGRAALRIRIPANRRSATVTTTRLRGWFLVEHGASGVGLWIRTKSGSGTASFSLLANAFTTNQIIARRVEATAISTEWTNVRLPFATFPKLPLGDVDLFSVELSGPPMTEFLIDDLHLLGRWRSDF